MSGFDYTQIQEIGIVSGILSAIGIAIASGVRRIYCKGKNDSVLNERINLLEQWKTQHIEEYQKLQDKNSEIKEEIYKIGKSLANIEGILEGNGTKE